MTVVHAEGGWIVVKAGEQLAGPFDTMAQAWRWIDRRVGDPINRREDIAEWLWRQGLDR